MNIKAVNIRKLTEDNPIWKRLKAFYIKQNLDKFFWIQKNQILLSYKRFYNIIKKDQSYSSYKKILRFFKENNIKDPILLAGYRKSGNTWVRFVIYNYFNILLNNSNKSLTFDQLNSIQYHYLERRDIATFKSGYPSFYRTHFKYHFIFNHFKVIYLYRNPLDTLISRYYYSKDRTSPFDLYPPNIKKNLFNIDYYVLYMLYDWISHYKSTINKCHLVLNYEKLRRSPYGEFAKIFHLLNIKIDEQILRNSIEMSSFNNIRKMSLDVNQQYGMADPDTFKGQFVRSGKSAQYLKELRPETIRITKAVLKKNRIKIQL